MTTLWEGLLGWSVIVRDIWNIEYNFDDGQKGFWFPRADDRRKSS